MFVVLLARKLLDIQSVGVKSSLYLEVKSTNKNRLVWRTILSFVLESMSIWQKKKDFYLKDSHPGPISNCHSAATVGESRVVKKKLRLKYFDENAICKLVMMSSMVCSSWLVLDNDIQSEGVKSF